MLCPEGRQPGALILATTFVLLSSRLPPWLWSASHGGWAKRCVHVVLVCVCVCVCVCMRLVWPRTSVSTDTIFNSVTTRSWLRCVAPCTSHKHELHVAATFSTRE